MNELRIILSMYFPLVVLILGVIYAISLKKVPDTGIPVNLWIFSFDIPIKNKKAVKAIIVSTLTVLAFSYYSFYLDISTFYPQNMKISVHYNDEQGIRDLTNELGIKKIGSYPIVETDSLARIHYFMHGDTVVQNYLNYNNYYSNIVMNQDKLVTEGRAMFKVEKISGIQSYQIVDSFGELEHERFLTDKSEKLTSRFSHVRSPYDKIELQNFSELFKKVITPEFTQTLIIDGKDNEFLDHTLYGVTAIYFFPYPSYSNTLYLYEKDETLIPIGYAVYY